MNTIKFLVAAYVATWAIHAFYIATLVTRFRKTRQQMDALARKK